MREYIQCSRCSAKSKLIAAYNQKSVYRCTQCRALTEINHAPETMPINFYCFDHQGKANKLISTLSERYNQGDRNTALFVLSDSDVSGRASQMERMRRSSARQFFIYPHAARPSLINAHYHTWQGTTAQFVVNEYHAEVLRAYGYEKPLESIGWHLSPVEQFKPRNVDDRPLKVLFAPIHPRNAQQDRDANKAAFDKLYPHVLSGDIELTIRHIGALSESGLPIAEKVNYVCGLMNQTTSDMDNSDVVIGHQTFAWLAVARGIPCVMFAEDMPTHFRRNGVFYDDVACWDKVQHLFRYPLDLLCENDTIGLLRQTAQSDTRIQDWRRRMIGQAFDPALFVEKVEKYL